MLADRHCSVIHCHSHSPTLCMCVCVRMRFSKTMKIIHNINFCFTYGSLAPRLLHFAFALRIFISLVQWSMLCLCYYFFVIYIDCSTCVQTYMCVRVCVSVNMILSIYISCQLILKDSIGLGFVSFSLSLSIPLF